MSPIPEHKLPKCPGDATEESVPKLKKATTRGKGRKK